MTAAEAGSGKGSFRLIVSDPAVRVVVLIVFVIMLGFGIIAPILPLYARSFGVSYDAASLLISAFAFMRLVSDPIVGPIVDRYGERLCAMTGVVAVGVSAVLAGLASNFPLVVVFRAAGGAGSSLVFAGLCFFSGLLYLRFMPDPDDVKEMKAAPEPAGDLHLPLWRRTRTQVIDVMKQPAFVTTVVLNMAFFWVVAGGYDTLVPLFARERLGMSPVGVGAVFGLAVTGEFLVLYAAGSTSDRIGRKPVLLVSLTCLAVMMAVLGC